MLLYYAYAFVDEPQVGFAKSAFREQLHTNKNIRTHEFMLDQYTKFSEFCWMNLRYVT